MRTKLVLVSTVVVLAAGILGLVGSGVALARPGVEITAAPQGIASVGDLFLTEDTTLAEDHNGRIFIVADNVSLDCAGHTVSGTGISGIHVEGPDGVTVKNCLVTGFNHGILLIDSDGSRILGNTSTENLEDGIRLNFSHNNEVTGNTASANVRHGIAVVGNFNIVRGNQAIGNGEDGFPVGSGFGNNTFVDNVSSGNVGHGFEILGPGGNSFERNQADDNGEMGFLFAGTANNRVDDNTANRNFVTGFYLEDADENVITASKANRNGVSGLTLIRATGNAIFGNSFAVNGQFGVHLAKADSNEFERNVVSGSGIHGWYFDDSDSNKLIGNSGLLSGAAGFSLEGNSTDNTLERNSATGNLGNGFRMDESSGHNVMLQNVARRNNTGYAIFGDGSQLQANVAMQNAADGFFLDGVLGDPASNNLLTSNVALMNDSAGFRTGASATDNTFTRNAACRNGQQDGAADAVDEGTNNVWQQNKFCTTEGI